VLREGGAMIGRAVAQVVERRKPDWREGELVLGNLEQHCALSDVKGVLPPSIVPSSAQFARDMVGRRRPGAKLLIFLCSEAMLQAEQVIWRNDPAQLS